MAATRRQLWGVIVAEGGVSIFVEIASRGSQKSKEQAAA
jgi:hypothetical protein